jgi:type I restriction enzyme, S subunit
MIGAKVNLDGKCLPEGWSVQLVGEIGEYINGYPFKPTEWKDQGLPIIRIQNLNDPAKPFNYFPNRLDERYLVRNADILISWSASLGTFLWQRGDAWLNQHIFKALPNETKVDQSFFYWAMVYAIDRIAKNARGSTMVHVTGKEFKGSEILLPTRAEQRKIAGVLGLVQRAIEQQERLIALTTELKKPSSTNSSLRACAANPKNKPI